MNDHTPNHSNASATRPSAADFAGAIPRGRILRSTEPVVAPVAPSSPMTDDRPASVSSGTMGTTHPGMHGAGVSDADVGGSRIHDRRADETGTYHADTSPTVAASSTMRRDEPDAARPARARTVTGVRDRRFSIGATFLGWAVASFFSLVFSALVLLALGAGAAADGTVGSGDVASLGAMGFVGVLIAMFLAYLIGGYAAGRIAHFDGAKHGAIVPVWTILFGLLAIFAGAYLGTQLAGYFTPALANVDLAALGTYGILGLLAMLVADFAGAILGGILGARGDQRYEDRALERRRTSRGRPL